MRSHLFIASSILGFAIGSASLARSGNIETLSFESLQNSGFEIVTGFPGGTWSQTGIEYVYADGYAYSSGSMELDLIRYSFTGTRTESVVNDSFGVGQFDLYMYCSAMATNPSPWDYYLLGLYGSSNEFTSQVSLIGVSAESF